MAGCEKEYCPLCSYVCDRYHVRIFCGKKEIRWECASIGARGRRGCYYDYNCSYKNIQRYMDKNYEYLKLSKFKRHKSDKVRMVVHYPIKQPCFDCLKVRHDDSMEWLKENGLKVRQEKVEYFKAVQSLIKAIGV
jgi:hypothetical protein